MSIYSIIFYILAAFILVTTGLAISRRNLVHAVVYLIFSFFGSAMLFYLFGAPFLAALEVIIYAGAIMVLFLFIIIMLKVETVNERLFPLSQWLPAAFFGLVYIILWAVLIIMDPNSKINLTTARAEPGRTRRLPCPAPPPSSMRSPPSACRVTGCSRSAASTVISTSAPRSARPASTGASSSRLVSSVRGAKRHDRAQGHAPR